MIQVPYDWATENDKVSLLDLIKSYSAMKNLKESISEMSRQLRIVGV